MCCKCFLVEHNGHPFGSIDSETKEEIQDKIKTLLEKAKPLFKKAEDHLEYINRIEIAKNERKEQEVIEAQIKGHYDPLIEKLTKEREKALEEAKEICTQDNKKIWSRQATLEKVVTDYKKARSESEYISESVDDHRVIQDGQIIISLLQKVIETELKLEDTEIMEMESRKYSPPTSECPNDDIKLIKTNPRVILDQPCVPKTILLKDEVKVEFSVSLKIGDHVSSRKQAWQPQVKIVHGYCQAEIPKYTCTKKDDKDEWVVTFHPVVAGTHCIMVSVQTDFAGEKIDKDMEPVYFKVKEKNSIQEGDKVEKGPDWSDGDNQQEVGVVKNVKDDGSVTVKWPETKGCYKWGHDGLYQVQLKDVTKTDTH